MKNPIRTMGSAVKEIFTSKKDIAVFIFFSIGFWFLFVFVPVWTTPGNDFMFQLSITPPLSHVLMAVLAILNGFLFAMHFFIRRHHRTKMGVRRATHSLGSLFGAVIATLGCASCYSTIISAFGVGAVSFVGEYRWLISAVALLITISAVYLTANRIENGCKACQIKLDNG